MSRTPAVSTATGVGLRLQHLAEVAATRPPAAWLEIHPENFLANPHARELLEDIASHYPISVHSVGVSIGSAGGVDRQHLARVKTLIDRLDPFLVSGHLAWSTHEGEYLNDLLPLPYDEESLRVLAAHVDTVQQALGRPYQVENPSNYLGFAGSTMTEVEFLTELVARTGCRLLCDVSNVHVSGANLGYDPYAYIDAMPAEAVGEMHLGGFVVEDEDGTPPSQVIIDTHSRPIDDHAWDLYAHALRRIGPRPTLIEWDNELPPFATLLAEAGRADRLAADVGNEEQLGGVAKPSQRFAIYQRHHRQSLMRHLLGRFPTLEWLIGSGPAAELAQAFLEATPPTAPCMAEYGERFPDFVAASDPGRRLPYLAPAARLDWQLGRTAVAVAFAPLAIDSLGAVPPDQLPDLRLALQPGAGYLEADWPVDELVQLRLGDQAPDRYQFEASAVNLEITGSRGAFRVGRLDAAGFGFRVALAAGETIGAAAEAAFAADPQFDAGGALAALFAAQLVCGVIAPEAGV
jgi:uncharacterized protein (UPF0276 family)